MEEMVNFKTSELTSLDGMLTTPVDLLFSLNFLFSICPLPFLALGPELFFSLLLLCVGLSLSLSSTPAGLELSACGTPLTFSGVFKFSPGGSGLFGSSFKAVEEEERVTGQEDEEETQLTELPLLFNSVVLPVAAAISPSIFALIFSRFAFHSSRKSVELLDLNPPVAMVSFFRCLVPARSLCKHKQNIAVQIRRIPRKCLEIVLK